MNWKRRNDRRLAAYNKIEALTTLNAKLKRINQELATMDTAGEEMKLKYALAKKYIATSNDAGDFYDEIVAAYVAGFDRCKAHYLDFAERFIGNPAYKPEEIIAAMKRIGEREGYGSEEP